MGAGGRFLASVQNELFENVSAHRAGIFEDRHGYLGRSFALIAQLAGSSFPDGEGVRGDHVKREIPGMRGRTKNQRIRKPA